MTMLFIGLVALSLIYLVSVPLVRLWYVPAATVVRNDRAPAWRADAG
jgi:hypothetical protein